LDSNRKKTGGKVEIQVNLREPLTGEDIVKKSERWLILDSFGSTVSQSLSSAGLTVGGPYMPVVNSPNISQNSPHPVVSSSDVQNSPMIIDTSKSDTPVEVATSAAVDSVQDIKMKEANEEGGELEQAEEEFIR
jgi:hypothetical protein